MRDDQLNAAVEKFIRNVSLTARREFEKNVRAALRSGKLKGQDHLSTAITLSAEKIGMDVTIHSKIEL